MAAEDERKAGETSTAREDGEVAPEREGEPDFTKKHPLECKWTLWFDNPKGGGQQQTTWGQTLRAVYTFDTVEDFWWCAAAAIGLLCLLEMPCHSHSLLLSQACACAPSINAWPHLPSVIQ